MNVDFVDGSFNSCNITDLPSIQREYSSESIAVKWQGSALREESTLHQISPYIGKIKSSMARALVSEFTSKNDIVYDPYSGAGTVAFEAWAAGCNVIANDLSPYASLITQAKLFPYASLEQALTELNTISEGTKTVIPSVDLRKVPKWVRSFFHPETLREAISWTQVLKLSESNFLLSCLLGILHHQRPGFLSYPSSHTVPYLRKKNFPSDIYPELYQFRSVKERLERKVIRALKRVPKLNFTLDRSCHTQNAAHFVPSQPVSAIITSPPYMRQLSYARDNRLRLWFLGEPDWKSLDQHISPNEKVFLTLFKASLKQWQDVLIPGGLCVLVLGDAYSRSYKMPLADAVAQIATKEVGGYSTVWTHNEPIPNNRRTRRGCSGSLTETILVLRNKK